MCMSGTSSAGAFRGAIFLPPCAQNREIDATLATGDATQALKVWRDDVAVLTPCRIAYAAAIVQSLCSQKEPTAIREALAALHEAAMLADGQPPLDVATRQVFASAVHAAVSTALAPASWADGEVPQWALDEVVFALETLPAVGCSIYTLPSLHTLPGSLLPAMLQLGRVEDAAETLVLLTQLGAPLSEASNLAATIDLFQALLEGDHADGAMAAVGILQKAELGDLATSSVMTAICNTFMEHMLLNETKQDVAAVYTMMQNKGIPSDSETVVHLKAAAAASQSANAAKIAARNARKQGSEQKSGGTLAAVLSAALVALFGGLYAASEQGLALQEQQKLRDEPDNSRQSIAEEYEWAVKEARTTARLIQTQQEQKRKTEERIEQLKKLLNDSSEELKTVFQQLEAEEQAAPKSMKASMLSRLGRKPHSKELLEKRSHLLRVQVVSQKQLSDTEVQLQGETEQLNGKREYYQHLLQSVKAEEERYAAASSGSSSATGFMESTCIAVAEGRLKLQDAMGLDDSSSR